MAHFHPQVGPHPGQYFVPGSQFAGHGMPTCAPTPSFPRHGKVVYKYHTPDGGPPNMGQAPRKPNEGGMKSFWPPMDNPFNPMYASGFGIPSVPSPAPVDSKEPKRRSSLKKGKKVHIVESDDDSDDDNDDSTAGSGSTVTVRVFEKNVLKGRRAADDGTIAVDGSAVIETLHFAEDMTVKEFIKKIGCVERAKRRVSTFPRYAVGIQEIYADPECRGRFIVGNKIMLNGSKAKSRLGKIWPLAAKHLSEDDIPFIVRLPVCKLSRNAGSTRSY